MLPIFRNAYFIAKENLAYLKAENLNLLTDL
jgi:hypothetical protein